MLSIVIAVLIQWGVITTSDQFYALPETQQQEYIEIIDEDICNQ